VFRRCEILRGQTVCIIGIGFLGAMIARLATRAGARVIAIARRPFALELARRFGAQDLVAMDDHRRIIESVRNLTCSRLCDCVIEAVGKQWPLDLAAELTKERGRLVIAGYHQDGPRQVNMQLWNWRGLDVINAHERDLAVYREGMRAAFDLLAAGALDIRPLLTDNFPLSELGIAFERATTRPDGFLKAWIRYT
jgi:threonine dehydrogenase-like Zn-dependent dehydrogenase